MENYWKIKLFKNDKSINYSIDMDNLRLLNVSEEKYSDYVNESLYCGIVDIGGDELFDRINDVDGWGIEDDEWNYKLYDENNNEITN